jgi:hypothetical protein
MSHFQDVVTEYLRADRAMFVNTECLIQIDPGDAVSKGTHWYCDAVAVNFRERAVFLCEVTYSSTLAALLGRLQAWSLNWPAVCAALVRDCKVPQDFIVQPWVFIPQSRRDLLERRLITLLNPTALPMPAPRVSSLESVVPWLYRTWDRKLTALDGESSDQRDEPQLPTAVVE